MIELNGAKFAKNEQEFTESLFSSKTCVGFYKKTKKTVRLYNMQKELIGLINEHKVLCSARKVDNAYWFSFCTINEIGRFPSYRHERDNIMDVLVKLGTN